MLSVGMTYKSTIADCRPPCVQVVWNAWLSTLGHAPLLDPTDLFTKVGGTAAVQHAADALAPVMSHAADAVSPFVSHACQVRSSTSWQVLV